MACFECKSQSPSASFTFLVRIFKGVSSVTSFCFEGCKIKSSSHAAVGCDGALEARRPCRDPSMSRIFFVSTTSRNWINFPCPSHIPEKPTGTDCISPLLFLLLLGRSTRIIAPPYYSRATRTDDGREPKWSPSVVRSFGRSAHSHSPSLCIFALILFSFHPTTHSSKLCVFCV